jgi:hypothetical protein
MTTYSELLKDPRWQKMRLEILNRDQFTCQQCGDSESCLHVHHCYYRKGNPPWEYEPESLVALCEECHELETACAFTERCAVGEALARRGARATALNDLACSVYDFPMQDTPYNVLSAFAWAYRNPAVQRLIIRLHQTHPAWCDAVDLSLAG